MRRLDLLRRLDLSKIDVAVPLIGKRIQSLRQYLNLSMRTFGERIGYSGTQISRLETGETKPSEEVLALISETYHVKPGYFEGGGATRFSSGEATHH